MYIFYMALKKNLETTRSHDELAPEDKQYIIACLESYQSLARNDSNLSYGPHIAFYFMSVLYNIGSEDFSQLQEVLREHGSQISFLGVPIDTYKAQVPHFEEQKTLLDVVFPTFADTGQIVMDAPFSRGHENVIWCVTNKVDYETALSRFGLTEAENRKNLQSVGLPYFIENTDIN